MPTYEYECSKGHQFEVEQRITEEPLTRCKICRSKATRLISPSTFILKGGGWYSDGYGSSKKSGSASTESSSTSSDSSSSDSSTGSSDSSTGSSDSSTGSSDSSTDSSTSDA